MDTTKCLRQLLPTSAMLTLVLVAMCSHLVEGYSVKLVVVNRELNQHDGITCWTCPNKTDNDACNKWAPDILCPHGHSWCKSVHRVNVISGRSLFVDKLCVMPEQCNTDVIGCHDTDIYGVQDCVSCCNEDYCNEHVPSNHTAAHSLSTFPGTNSTAASQSTAVLLWTLCLIATASHWLGV